MSTDEPPGPQLQSLVAACLSRLEVGGPGALDDFCDQHPDHAAAIRLRVGALSAAGLLDDGEPPGAPLQVGGFRLLRRLGGGGMGVVHLAEQVELGRLVAVKLVRPELLLVEAARQRFAREVEAVARLRHAGIVPVHAAGEDAGVPFLAMEYIEGATLAQVIDALRDRAPSRLRSGDGLQAVDRLCPRARDDQALADTAVGTQPTPPSSDAADVDWQTFVCRLGVQAADALQHAHDRGVLHRDIKPSNLMLGRDGRLSLLDFGLALADGDARLTVTGQPMGSLAYMAPEQALGRRTVGATTDVYGLGTTLFELLALRLPFDSPSHQELMNQIVAGRPPSLRTINPGVSAELATVVACAMQPETAHRYASAAALRDDLSAVLEQRPTVARPPGPWWRARAWTRRHPVRAMACVLGVLVAVGGPLTWALAQREANQVTNAALQRAEGHRDDAWDAIDAMLADVARRDLALVPGLEDVRSRLLTKALDLSERLTRREGGAPEASAITARASYRVGLIRSSLGEYDAAEVALTRARERATRHLSAVGDDPQALEIAALAAAELALLADLGAATLDGGALRTEAERAFRVWRATTGDPGADDGLAGMLYQAAVGALDAGRLEAAHTRATRALQLQEGLLADAPDDRTQRLHVALSLTIAAEALARQQRATEAEPHLLRAVDVLSRLHAERIHDPLVMHALGMARISLGKVWHGLGRLDDGIAQLELGVARLELLRSLAPDSPTMRMPLATARAALGEALGARGDVAAAVGSYVEALTIYEQELARPDALPRHRADRGAVALGLAQVLRDAGEWDEALRVLDWSIDAQREAVASRPDVPGWTLVHYNLLYTRALIRLDSGRPEEAVRDAVEIQSLSTDRPSAALTAMGLVARSALLTDDRDQATHWVDLAIDWLDVLIASGWRDAAALTDSTHYDGLRHDPRFQLRLTDLSTHGAASDDPP